MPNGEFNLGSENPPCIRDLLRFVCEQSGSKSILLPTWAWGVKWILGALGVNFGVLKPHCTAALGGCFFWKTPRLNLQNYALNFVIASLANARRKIHLLVALLICLKFTNFSYNFNIEFITKNKDAANEIFQKIISQTRERERESNPATIKVPIHIPVYYGDLLKGRSALITGGNSGIGFAIAEAFLRNGASVIIAGRNVEKLQNAAQSLRQISPSADFTLLDNENMQSVKEGFERALNIANIDILVNNAGVICGDFSNFNEKEFDKTLNTNLKSVYFLSSLFATHIKAQNIKANILNLASSSSLRPAFSPYTLSKWGIRGLTLGLAKALIPYDIVVNALAPGPTATPMLVPKTQESIDLPSSPIKRYATAPEIANMAVMLVSDMGRSIVGDCIYMTGGAGLITFDDIGYGF